MRTELDRANAFEDVCDRTHALLSELSATVTLLRLSQIAWSPTLKAHAAELAVTKEKLESELNALRTEPV